MKHAAKEASEKRGVFHRAGVDGSFSFELVDSEGVVQFEVRPAEKHCNQQTFSWLQAHLDTIDPSRAPLRIA